MTIYRYFTYIHPSVLVWHDQGSKAFCGLILISIPAPFLWRQKQESQEKKKRCRMVLLPPLPPRSLRSQHGGSGSVPSKPKAAVECLARKESLVTTGLSTNLFPPPDTVKLPCDFLPRAAVSFLNLKPAFLPHPPPLFRVFPMLTGNLIQSQPSHCLLAHIFSVLETNFLVFTLVEPRASS